MSLQLNTGCPGGAVFHIATINSMSLLTGLAAPDDKELVGTTSNKAFLKCLFTILPTISKPAGMDSGYISGEPSFIARDVRYKMHPPRHRDHTDCCRILGCPQGKLAFEDPNNAGHNSISRGLGNALRWSSSQAWFRLPVTGSIDEGCQESTWSHPIRTFIPRSTGVRLQDKYFPSVYDGIVSADDPLGLRDPRSDGFVQR